MLLLGAVACAALAVQGAPAFAVSATDNKRSIKIPGMLDQDAIEHFQLQPFNISVIRDGRVERIISLTVTLETRGDTNKSKIMAERQRLHNAFLQDLHGIASKRRNDGQVVDFQVVKIRLMEISSRVLGADVVQNVLVYSIFDREIR